MPFSHRMAAVGASEEDPQLVAHQLAAEAGENGRTFDQACTLGIATVRNRRGLDVQKTSCFFQRANVSLGTCKAKMEIPNKYCGLEFCIQPLSKPRELDASSC